jgi:hypothetical protein
VWHEILKTTLVSANHEINCKSTPQEFNAKHQHCPLGATAVKARDKKGYATTRRY